VIDEYDQWMNDACNALVYRDGVRVRDCQCPALEVGHAAGVLEGRLQMVKEIGTWLRSGDPVVMDRLMQPHVAAHLIEAKHGKGGG
jgi:hypothetical protein